MQLQQSSYVFSYLKPLYEELKFWLFLGGGLWGVFKVVKWFQEIRNTDLKHVHEGMATLSKEVKEQTGSIVSELKELRGDIRMFTSAFIMPPPVRARKK